MNQIENTIDCRSQEPWSIEDYIIYSDNRKEIKGFRCPGYCGQIVIPEPVETIAYGAFQKSNISGVIFPPSLKKIGTCAFSQCPNLKEIVIPDSVEVVNYEAFSSCEKLRTVTVQGEHTHIDDTCFEKCTNIKSVFLANPKPELLFSIFADSEIEEFGSSINGNSIDIPSFIHSQENALRFASIYYHSCGMNITKVLGTPGDYTSYKSPSDSWGYQIEDFFEQGQTTSLILQENWFRHSGIGLVLGWNGYRALDIDDVDLEYWNNNDNKEIHYTLNDVVEKFLAILNLPKDYQWVVKSGSNRGFHIIFKSGDNTDYGITTLAYRGSYYYRRFFSRIEIRWKDHLILPPSISSSGNRYQFLNNDFPTCLPSIVSLECIDNLINTYCGEPTRKKYEYQGVCFELIELRKQPTYESGEERCMPEVDNLLWLKSAGTPEAYNSLGIIYILGRNVQQDKEKSLEYFRKADNDMAFFNIASLSACGLFPGGRAFVERYLDKISDLNGLLQSSSSSKQIDINYSMTLILENINNTASSETLIFLDTETAGLPLREDAPASDSANWPRLVQISWIVSDMAGNKLSTSSYIIKPNGFNIPQDAMQIHGISTDTARRFGKDLSSILNKFLHDTNCAKKIIGHNIDFDINVVAAELYRTGIKDSLSTIDRICTMKSTINYCQLGGGPDFKYPKLEELYFKLFGRHILSAHNASSDVEATFKCYWELKQRHIIQ